MQRDFRSARAGNVAITFALASLPLMGMVGAAIDYSHASSLKTTMQSALDSTALAMSHSAASSTSSQLQTSATAYFNALFNPSGVTGTQFTINYNSASSTITVAASASMPTSFLRIAGFQQLNISDTSTVTWGSPKLQVALVLDNTGSMNEFGKISALKTASNQLLTQLQNAAQNPGDIQVAIIPFTTDVNIGTSFASQSWIDWSLFSGSGAAGSSCSGYSLWSGWPCSSSGGSGFGGFGGFGSGSGSSSSTSAYQSQWNGCVTDRTQNYDVQNTTPVSTNTQTYFPADPSPPLNGCPAQIMPMGYNWTAMHNLINSMVANGETNLTIGLAWGWQALTGGVPLSDPAPPAGTQQVIIFMTDGLNTADRWYNTFLGTGTQAQIDARTQLVCTNIKATNITVYVIQVDTDNESPASTLLQNCATNISMWYLLTDPNDLPATFGQIATSLTPLHISQ